MVHRAERTTMRGCPKQARITANAGNAANTAMPPRWVQALIAERVEVECGVSPRRAQRNSVAWQAYMVSLSLLERDLLAWRKDASQDAVSPDLKAFATVAASRGCWATLTGSDARRARIRSQIRCVLALTPDFALWNVRNSHGERQRRTEWLGGRAAWRDAGYPAVRLAVPRYRRGPHATLSSAADFNTVRAVVLELVDLSGAPVALEALVAEIDKRCAENKEEPVSVPRVRRRRGANISSAEEQAVRQ